MQRLGLGALPVLSFLCATPASAGSFALFESGQVRPLALSPDGERLFAVNTPDNRLEIFEVTGNGLLHSGSIAVGLEPVAVEARSDDEVWVVNHLSDSVSVVDVSSPQGPRVARTLLVGDEPRDIVFGGPSRQRAFITTAHRGQNAPFDPQLTTPGVGRADVWVFDAANLGASALGGTPLTIITLFTDTPRALSVTPDGSRVYAAGFHTGNRTTTLHRFVVEDGHGPLPPFTDHLGVPQPSTPLIVKFDGSHWVDAAGRTWDDSVKFNLPDKDVFVIDATASPPAQLPGTDGFHAGVGTVLFNMIVNPVNGKVYVTNTEANNLERFEGPGIFGGSTVQGHLHESRITVLSPGSVEPRHLNKHIDYSACCAPLPNAENERSLATPLGMAITSDGATLYVAALGSSKIGVFDTAALEDDTFAPSAADHIALDHGGEPVGPTGLVLDEARGRLYVMTRFDNSIAVVDTATRAVDARVPLHNPEPPSVVEGRRFLYDAKSSSSNGEASCASCHVFGDVDSLAWDLGNPDATTLQNPGPIFAFFGTLVDFYALKGPMTTQSLRGLANHGSMHWRGDRTGGYTEPSAQPNSGIYDEREAFRQFLPAFVSLQGRSEPIPASDMEKFIDFALQIMYPPNPIRNLDNSLTPDQQAGLDHMLDPLGVVQDRSCEDCHTIDPTGNAELGEPFPGFFGSDGRFIGSEVVQSFKVPHLRNMYQKVGMFGMASIPTVVPGDNDHKGDQIRGFGFLNDGAHDTIFRFMRTAGFDKANGGPNGFDDSPGADGDVKRRQVEQYILAFDSNLAPIVGQQVTLTQDNAAAALPRINLLVERAEQSECDLVVKTPLFGEERGYLYDGAGSFLPDRSSSAPLTKGLLVASALLLDHPVTFTCVPPGSGERIGVDRDEDGWLDGDELDACTDPADPFSP
ncbi:hypothetical protein [Sorangium cellulosum]|nr:hypothetical protein [Sorangium cellulosum]